MAVDLTRCRAALNEFARKRVLVIGDLMLDEHIWGTVGRISPEAPVMVVEVNSHQPDNRPGGAANVANNIRALGAAVTIVGVVGDDEGGRMLLDCLKGGGVDTSGVFVDKGRPTTRKTRIWASNRHQVVRVDRESNRKIPSSLAARIVDYVREAARQTDAILLSDYDKGVITRDTAQTAIALAADAGMVCASNPKPRNLACFTGVGAMTLNQSEACAASGIDIACDADVEKAGAKLLRVTQCGGVVITRGAHGLTVFRSDGKPVHIPAVESEVYDVAGAGDTVVSALTLALACGLDLANAGVIANCSGGAVVRKVGVATTSVRDIDQLLASAPLL